MRYQACHVCGKKYSSSSQSERMSLPQRPWEGLPAALAEPLIRGVEPTGEEIVATIRAGVPAYGRPLEGGFEQGLRDGVAAALRQFVGLIAGAADPGAL